MGCQLLSLRLATSHLPLLRRGRGEEHVPRVLGDPARDLSRREAGDQRVLGGGEQFPRDVIKGSGGAVAGEAGADAGDERVAGGAPAAEVLFGAEPDDAAPLAE